jgi:FdhD protein
VRRPVLRITPDGAVRRPDALAAEEPLELRVDGIGYAVTMRTPGNDVELAHGFLLSEGVIGAAGDVLAARYCSGRDAEGRQTYNVLDVALAPGVPAPSPGMARNVYTSSSCGVCGKASLDAVRQATRYSPAGRACRLSPAVLHGLPDTLRAAQAVFDATGGLHAAGLFTATGELIVAREDIGRHNAVDKVLGAALMSGAVPPRPPGTPGAGPGAGGVPAGDVLMVSGRASFELVQKAAMAGVPVLAAVSAPSSLAVDLAAEQGLTLVGFLRGGSMNVYTGTERILLDAA